MSDHSPLSLPSDPSSAGMQPDLPAAAAVAPGAAVSGSVSARVLAQRVFAHVSRHMDVVYSDAEVTRVVCSECLQTWVVGSAGGHNEHCIVGAAERLAGAVLEAASDSHERSAADLLTGAGGGRADGDRPGVAEIGWGAQRPATETGEYGEPWKMFGTHTVAVAEVFNANGVLLVDPSGSDCMEEDDLRNSRRIVACVNFCVGISNEALSDIEMRLQDFDMKFPLRAAGADVVAGAVAVDASSPASSSAGGIVTAGAK